MRAMAGLALLAALAAIPTRADAYCRMVTGDGRQPADLSTCAPLATDHDHYLFWSHRCSELSISSAEPPHSLTIAQVQDVFRAAAATWAALDCGSGLDLSPRFSITVLADTNECSHSGHNGRGHNVNSIMFIDDDHEWTEVRGWTPIAFAVTLAWHLETTGEIVDVDMEINESRGAWTICPESGCMDGSTTCDPEGCASSPGPVDLQDVVTHELGHYLGIGHTTRDHPEATMFASAQFGEIQKRTLETDDIAALCDAYRPGSLADSCDPAPSGGLSLDCQAHDCGCGVPGSGPAGDRSGWLAAGGIGLVLAGRIFSRRRSR